MRISLSLTKHHAIVTYGEVKVQLHTFLNSALHCGITFILFYFREKVTRYILDRSLGRSQYRSGSAEKNRKSIVSVGTVVHTRAQLLYRLSYDGLALSLTEHSVTERWGQNFHTSPCILHYFLPASSSVMASFRLTPCNVFDVPPVKLRLKARVYSLAASLFISATRCRTRKHQSQQ
jgi:hypothetical protein